jgi:hypothetical protein
MSEQSERRVRVWFGETAICDYTGEAEFAARYEAAMRRRFPGLRVTNEPGASGQLVTV